MKIAIVPVPSFPKPAVWLECVDTVVTLGFGLNTEYRLLDEDLQIVSARARASLTPEQYDAWTGSDTFVVQSIAANLGLTPA